MHEKLIGALKKCGYPGDVHYCRDCFLSDSGGTCRMKNLLPAATDVIEDMNRSIDGLEADNESLCQKIEELSKKRVGTWHRVKATQRSYSFVCNSCGSMYPYLTRCCPNCGVEYIDEEPPKEET